MNNEYCITPEGTYCIFLYHSDGTPVHVILEEADLEAATAFKGHFYPFKHPRTGKIYARGYYRDPVTKKVQQPLLHRLIMKPERGENTTHINGDTLDCTRANMRNVEIGVDIKAIVAEEKRLEDAKAQQPQEPLKGVSLHKVKQRWEVSPFHKGKRYRLGYWDKDDLAGANLAVTTFREIGPEEYFKRYPKKGGKT